ncbi:MAG: IPExxxVDY family protein [Bacteroidia bacterium]|nr:IPExxxVDY family protein [Bacteroidia bacterium]NNM24082.1 IPExxxVDY family protein [Flavobacteriaceae bacterium]
MAVHKIVLDNDFAEEYSLIALHCAEEDYKMAYSLNRYLDLRLKRRRLDLEFQTNGLDVNFPLFEFEDKFRYTTYHLVGNKCKTTSVNAISSGGLFDAQPTENVHISYLLPEFKRADYFLKITSEYDTIPLRNHLAGINEINQVISAYEVEVSKVKSYNHLIFN